MEQYLRVGVVTAPHGVRGEVKVFPTTDDVKRFKKLTHVILDTGREKKEMEIEQVKLVKNLVVLKFRGLDDRDAAEALRQKELLVPREEAVPLAPDENYIGDLIGLSVLTDEGESLGILTDVMETGANDVYCVKMESGKELLLPAIRQCILNVDLERQEMTVHLLPGLLDL